MPHSNSEDSPAFGVGVVKIAGGWSSQPHRGRLSLVLPPRPRAARADCSPQVPGNSSQADPADVPTRHERNVRVSAHAAASARGGAAALRQRHWRIEEAEKSPTPGKRPSAKTINE